ncbi:hypothetical protein VOLCADRAFT_98299 [Volvox carteri f. nagariensis]|uniref:Elongator complex protein 4 n=1 Tax=Volvox carteri f. nagariensis TaxID=3068 RepID=D8UEU9_VOLCA|nr:uncharacterized protein VOLCADRAFT_98299 [Volvox carteri f. nagariensis]EFJ41703.1 hypothetical protein VOLCADRAFT_98299 [Volvox carteri f. nagariensis]|eukprot:XP_002957205.1 hypothetical protein VOLCADRAFT_98299 [Volvox carteri f. nagariensis]
MGLVDLDRLLSGGLPLSSVLLVIEDTSSGQHLNLMRYFIAEGVACRQRVLWLTANPPPGGPGAFLPADASASQSGGSAAEEGGDSSKDKEQPELRIAWQYKKYIKDEQQPVQSSYSTRGSMASSSSSSAASTAKSLSSTSPSSSSSATRAVAAGVGREWCHSFDLTRPLGAEALKDALLDVVHCTGPDAYGEADGRAATFISSLRNAAGAGPGPGSAAVAAAALAARRTESPVGRLVIESPGSLAWGIGASEQALVRLLYNIRQQAMQARCAVMVTVPAGLLSPGCSCRLPHLADTVLALEGLADDLPLVKLLPDPNTAVALLSVRKLSSAGMVGPRLPDGQLYVVRHKRRRLGLSPVEVDPDAEELQAAAAARAVEAFGGKAAAAAGSGGGAVAPSGGTVAVAAKTGKKSAASLLCGGPPAAGNKALDF